MSKNFGYGLIPIALVLTPIAAFALTYDDIGDFFKNAVNNVGGDRPPTSQFSSRPLNAAERLNATSYSSFGAITEREVTALNNLKFPQSFRAMRRRFGAPSYFRGNEEWFERSSGEFVVIQYDGNRAIGVRYEGK